VTDPAHRLLPIGTTDRIEVLDILRGIAILGILPVNMLFFASPLEWVADPPWRGVRDSGALFLIHFFFSAKFYTIFSLLFGVGIAMQVERLQEGSVSVINRRLVVLFVIGYLHIGLFWYGDILHWYAILGLLLLRFRTKDAEDLVPPAIAFLGLPVAIVVISLAMASFNSPSSATPAWMTDSSVAAYQSGDLVLIASQRWKDYLVLESGSFVYLPHVFSMFLFGMALGKIGAFREVDRHRNSFRKALSWGLIPGVPINLAWVVGSFWADPNTMTPLTALVTSLRFLGGFAFASVYVSAIVLIHRATESSRGWIAVANVGRTSLSNYILQSVVCTTIYYGYGFGLFGTRGPAFGLSLAFGVLAFQMLASFLWLKRFQQGPIEWVWRKVAYGGQGS